MCTLNIDGLSPDGKIRNAMGLGSIWSIPLCPHPGYDHYQRANPNLSDNVLLANMNARELRSESYRARLTLHYECILSKRFHIYSACFDVHSGSIDWLASLWMRRVLLDSQIRRIDFA